MKTVWHTDIVVDGKGMNLKLKPGRGGCYRLAIMPDVPGKVSKKAVSKFRNAVKKQPSACSASSAKDKVTKAIRASKARWNGWHREAYD